jgi:hypothetical protein
MIISKQISVHTQDCKVKKIKIKIKIRYENNMQGMHNCIVNTTKSTT